MANAKRGSMGSLGIGRIVEIQQTFADDVEASGLGEGIAVNGVEALGSGNGITGDEDICLHPFLTSSQPNMESCCDK
jgi:hypothetical protein